MSASTTGSLEEIERRLREKRLFGSGSDSLSLRVPGRNELVFQREGEHGRRISYDDPLNDDESLHAQVYRMRPDVGGVVLGDTTWTTAFAAMRVAMPTLFDEQARHIGLVPAPVADTDDEGLGAALTLGGNCVLVGSRRLGLGSTPNRVVLNADLFEKCAKAFVVASSTGQRVKTLPPWAARLWSARLENDQVRAAAAYASGRVPEGMDAY